MGSNREQKREHIPTLAPICMKKHPKSMISGVFLVAGVGFEPHGLRVMSPTSYQAALPRDIKLRLGVFPPFHNPPGYRCAPPQAHSRFLRFAGSLENSLLRAVSLRKNDTQSFLLVHPTSYQAALPRDIILGRELCMLSYRA